MSARPSQSVVVVSHEATRTGAPAMALRTRDALIELGCEVRVVLRAGGARAADFGGHRREPLKGLRVLTRRCRRLASLADRADELAAFVTLLRTPGEVVWCNTTKSANYVRPALRLRRRVVLHSHEMRELLAVVQRYRPARWRDRVTLVGCSRASADALASELGVPAETVHVILSAPLPTDGRAIDPAASDVVGGCGTPDLRKGVDTFDAVAAAVDRATFRWIGGTAAGLPNIDFVPPVTDVDAELRRLGLFLLTSRADAAPLVVLEAMRVGLPVAGFAVDGVPEQVGECGVLVSPGAVDELVEVVQRLVDSPDERRRLGGLARRRSEALCSDERWRADVEAVYRAASRR